ncbi:MAG: GTPase domain-containing protein [Haliscomenobacter sp.]|nr:GTPase domain-containing protein [Haliscomenobacter sp.]
MSSKPVPLKIGIFGDKGVGKTTYLTTLHGVLSSHRYDDIEVRYEDENTAIYLKRNFNKLLANPNEDGVGEFSRVDSTSGEYDIKFDLFYKTEKKEHHFKIEMRDFPGEKIKVEGKGIQNVISFLGSCDAILYFFSIPDKLDNPEDQSFFDLNMILAGLTKLENARKTKKPFVLMLTKSDEVVKRENAEFSSIDELNKIIKNKIEEESTLLISELQRFVENFKIISTSSYFTLDHFRRNKIGKVKRHASTNNLIDYPNFDVAFPITYVLEKNLKYAFWDTISDLLK